MLHWVTAQRGASPQWPPFSFLSLSFFLSLLLSLCPFPALASFGADPYLADILLTLTQSPSFSLFFFFIPVPSSSSLIIFTLSFCHSICLISKTHSRSFFSSVLPSSCWAALVRVCLSEYMPASAHMCVCDS